MNAFVPVEQHDESSPPDATEPRPVILADLDGTLVHSRRRCPDLRGARVIERYEGRDVGFISPKAWDMLGTLQADATVVPATARTVRQYSRIEFPTLPAVALVAGGGLILVDGVPDPGWSSVTQAMLDSTDATVEQVVERMATLRVTEEPRNGDDRFACVKVAAEADTSGFGDWCAKRGWRVVRQDGRIYAMAAQLSKAAAAPRLSEIVGDAPSIVLGDGLMDLEMMALVRHRFTPMEGALWRSGSRLATPVEGVGLQSAEAMLAAAAACLGAVQSNNKVRSSR